MRALVLALSATTALAQAPMPNPYTIVSPPPTLAKHAMVVTIHHDASDAGVESLKPAATQSTPLSPLVSPSPSSFPRPATSAAEDSCSSA